MLRHLFADLQNTLSGLDPGAHAWASKLLAIAANFIRVSVLDPGGRYYWVTFVEAMIVLGIAYAVRSDWRAHWGRGGFLRFCFPRGFFMHASTITDVKINVINFLIMPVVNVTWRLNAAYFITLVTGGMVWMFGPAPRMLHWNTATLVCFTILIAVLDDFGYWVWHYLAHKVPFLWAFHKVHHSAEVLTPLVAGRVHPLEAMLLPIFRTAAASLGTGAAFYFFSDEAHLVTIFGMGLVAGIFAAAGDQLFHAHVPISWGRLNYLFISPATHQVHHSVERRHWDKNMGAFLAVWDWIFGTLYLPDSRQELRYGVAENTPQPHHGLLRAYMRPFLDMLPRATWRRLRSRFGRGSDAVAQPPAAPMTPRSETMTRECQAATRNHARIQRSHA